MTPVAAASHVIHPHLQPGVAAIGGRERAFLSLSSLVPPGPYFSSFPFVALPLLRRAPFSGASVRAWVIILFPADLVSSFACANLAGRIEPEVYVQHHVSPRPSPLPDTGSSINPARSFVDVPEIKLKG